MGAESPKNPLSKRATTKRLTTATPTPASDVATMPFAIACGTALAGATEGVAKAEGILEAMYLVYRCWKQISI